MFSRRVANLVFAKYDISSRMLVSVIIQHKKLPYVMLIENDALVDHLKLMVARLLNMWSHNIQLYCKDQIMDENKTLLDSGIRSDLKNPTIICLAFKTKNGEFEKSDTYHSPKYSHL